MTQAEKDIVDDVDTGIEMPTDILNVNIADNFPKSTIDDTKLSVHASYKPKVDGHTTYAIWTGAGDDMTDPENGNGNGPMLQIHTEVGVPESSIDIEFNPMYGRIWLHEAYAKFTGGGSGDYMSASVLAYGVPLQQAVSLNLIVDADDFIKFSPAGPGTGTHGFADPTKITLIERSFSNDGDWNYDTNDGLTPNLQGEGRFKMSTVNKTVHRFINKVPCFGSCETYFSMSSDETTELRPGYFARLTAHNVSDTEWDLSCLMELYREVTYSI